MGKTFHKNPLSIFAN